jgi:hypothetical protein
VKDKTITTPTETASGHKFSATYPLSEDVFVTILSIAAVANNPKIQISIYFESSIETFIQMEKLGYFTLFIKTNGQNTQSFLDRA